MKTIIQNFIGDGTESKLLEKFKHKKIKSIYLKQYNKKSYIKEIVKNNEVIIFKNFSLLSLEENQKLINIIKKHNNKTIINLTLNRNGYYIN